jgi:GTP cyclohydrolase I
MQVLKTLPDVAKSQQMEQSYLLNWVGMENIAVPLTLQINNTTQNVIQQTVPCKASVYVSLDDEATKGIHMSRLHALLNQLAHSTCTKDSLNTLLDDMVESQGGISQNAKLNLSFDLLLPKSSLLSNKTGYQAYQIDIKGSRSNNKYEYELHLNIPYSSTCPCSAALSRQLFADAIDHEFTSADIKKQALLEWASKTTVATPHSQRSYVYLKLSLGNHQWPSLPLLIKKVEAAIGTPVQTMVKRKDEQEFARLNANNLMFCEDAARKIKAMLEQTSEIKDYWYKIEHQESLHAHNAVVIDQKHQ